MWESATKHFREIQSVGDYCSLRLLSSCVERVTVRQDVVQPLISVEDVGGMVTVVDGDGVGYAATSDLTKTGLQEAARRAAVWAKRSRGRRIQEMQWIVRFAACVQHFPRSHQ